MIHREIDRKKSYELLLETLGQKNFRPETAYNPLMVALELTTFCNLRCIRCERHAIDPVHLNHHMTRETFDRLFPLFSYVRGVSIVGGLGEPLMEPNLWEYFAELKSAGCQVQYFTNGTLWTDEIIRKTFEGEVDAVAFSIDSLDATTYEQLKTGGRYGHSIDRIETFLRLRRNVGAKTKLMLNCAVQRDTLDHMLPLVRFAAEKRVDKLWFTGVITHTDQQLMNSHLQLPLAALEERFAEIQAEADSLGVSIRLPGTRIDGRQVCKDLWTNLYIFYNGDICCCPHFREPKTYYYHVENGRIITEARHLPSTVLGNAHSCDVLEVWDGEAHRRIRSAMLQGNPDFPCRGCHFSYDLH